MKTYPTTFHQPNDPPIKDQTDGALNVEKPLLSEETIESLQELGEVLRKIHYRLLSEGYIFRDGQFFKPDPGDKDHAIND